MSTVADLTRVDWWHEPNLAYSSFVPERFGATMVGWLGDVVSNTGEVSSETIQKLRWAYNHRTIDQGWLGEHECELLVSVLCQITGVVRTFDPFD